MLKTEPCCLESPQPCLVGLGQKLGALLCGQSSLLSGMGWNFLASWDVWTNLSCAQRPGSTLPPELEPLFIMKAHEVWGGKLWSS